jgi:hypothetical protein
MRSMLIVASLLSSVGILAGCATKPLSVRQVDESVLPAQAKSLLTPDAQIDKVVEETYSKGTVMYVIHYTIDGRSEVVKYNTKQQSTPTGVFEEMN